LRTPGCCGDRHLNPVDPPRREPILSALGPGLLLAATGVGAGDLATASLAGSLLGVAILWAVALGALLKYVVTEGLARWQLATGTTFLEGCVERLGPAVVWIFLPYLVLWSFFVAAALMGACGVTLHAILPVFDEAAIGKVVFGIASSVVGLALVWRGGYRLFERVMRVCVGVMFVTVVVTATVMWPGTGAVLRGLLVPTIPAQPGALAWVLALMGGVGGTVTVLCYGYWLREEGRDGPAQLGVCRIDLAVGYLMTAVFGFAMVIIGRSVTVEGQGAGLLVQISDRLADAFGPVGRFVFLIGAFGAVFSSLLGVWQAAPYLFADCWRMRRGLRGAAPHASIDTSARHYRGCMALLATVPAIGLFFSFREMQKLYALTGLAFFPVLALALLLLNSRTAWIGRDLRNGFAATIGLAGVLVVFLWIAIAGVSTT
jgi:Mn2+/Fe2+ NRAMP family transporter